MNPLADDVLKMVWLFDRGDQRQDAVRDLAKRIDAEIGRLRAELEAARKEIERLTQSAELAALSSGFLAHERSENERLREDVRRKDEALKEVADHAFCPHGYTIREAGPSGRESRHDCQWKQAVLDARAALSPKNTEPERCPEREDGTHCVHWWDGEEPCYACGDNTDPKSTEGKG